MSTSCAAVLLSRCEKEQVLALAFTLASAPLLHCCFLAGNFAKARKPEQVEATRYTMFLRLLYVVVRFAIPPELVFNMDETGVQLLYFGDYGRALL